MVPEILADTGQVKLIRERGLESPTFLTGGRAKVWWQKPEALVQNEVGLGSDAELLYAAIPVSHVYVPLQTDRDLSRMEELAFAAAFAAPLVQ